jgi:putative ubiquitin-RnfH superfamily antitoxin RatB of RatAB toxin-antitoxin module
MAEADKIEVEVAYALPGLQVVLPVQLAPGAVVEDAIRQSGILDQFPEIDLAANKVGVFGKLAKLDATVQAGDRVEIYRALIADPKEARRKKAVEQQQTGKRYRPGAGDKDGSA